MSCYHPLKRFVVSEDFKHDRDLVIIRPAFVMQDGRLQEVKCLVRDSFAPVGWSSSCSVPPHDSDVVFGSMIRCGKCMGCRIDKSKEWANRCLLELQDHSSAYFLTLTYDDQFVPLSYYSDPSSGEALPSLTLRKRDFQLFIKRLRKRHVKSLRYFACGEYGDSTLRPHYHAIVFGLELADLVPYGKNHRGEMLYTSDFVHSVWSDRKAPTRHGSVTPLTADKDYFCTPLGRVTISPVTWETCAYVARYTTKKLYAADASMYDEFNIEPPFLLMSRHPGIGANYLQQHPEVKDFEFVSVKTDKGGVKFRKPYYFQQKIYDEYDDYREVLQLKADRQAMMQQAVKAQLAQTSLNYGELLAIKEQKFKNRIKSLRRDSV